MRKLARYFWTLINLKPRQVLYLVWYRLYRPSIRSHPAGRVPYVRCDARFARIDQQPALDFKGATLFGIRHEFDLEQAWNVDEQALWMYNLHYFDDIWSQGAIGKEKEHDTLLAQWIQANDDVSTVAWDPYPLSRRIVNWCKYLWANPDQPPSECVLQSLASQADLLQRRLEYHLLANHLFANAKALIFAGTLLGGNLGRRLLERGIKLLRDELTEQFLADGGHFERSPMYHNSMTWDLLDLLALASSNAGQPLLICRTDLEGTATNALRFSKLMSHTDGRIPFFNDSTFGVAPDYAELAAYAVSLGICVDDALSIENDPDKVSVVDLSDSGFTVVESLHYKAILNTGGIEPSYQPGHCHADTLAFELSVGLRRVFVNSGTSEYEAGDTRKFERSTRAHNTVEIGDSNSSDVWGGFRVAKRARTFDRSIDQFQGGARVVCSHDGYDRKPLFATHHRTWDWEARRVVIADRISGQRESGIARFHLHPSAETEVNDDGYILRCGSVLLTIKFSCGLVDIKRYEWRPGMRKREHALLFAARFEKELHTTVTLVSTE